MSTFGKKFGKLIPGTIILALHLLFIILVTTGDFSGPRVAAGKWWVQGLGILFMAATVLYGYKYPYDGPNMKSGNVNAPTIAGIIFLLVFAIVGWVLYYWGGVYAY